MVGIRPIYLRMRTRTFTNLGDNIYRHINQCRFTVSFVCGKNSHANDERRFAKERKKTRENTANLLVIESKYVVRVFLSCELSFRKTL